MSHKAKTQGYQWVEWSLIAFNGSGYADRKTAIDFMQSYIDYKKWKRDDKAVSLANQFYVPLLLLAEQLLPSQVAKQPSPKNWKRFKASKSNTSLL